MSRRFSHRMLAVAGLGLLAMSDAAISTGLANEEQPDQRSLSITPHGQVEVPDSIPQGDMKKNLIRHAIKQMSKRPPQKRLTRRERKASKPGLQTERSNSEQQVKSLMPSQHAFIRRERNDRKASKLGSQPEPGNSDHQQVKSLMQPLAQQHLKLQNATGEVNMLRKASHGREWERPVATQGAKAQTSCADRTWQRRCGARFFKVGNGVCNPGVDVSASSSTSEDSPACRKRCLDYEGCKSFSTKHEGLCSLHKTVALGTTAALEPGTECWSTVEADAEKLQVTLTALPGNWAHGKHWCPAYPSSFRKSTADGEFSMGGIHDGKAYWQKTHRRRGIVIRWSQKPQRWVFHSELASGDLAYAEASKGVNKASAKAKEDEYEASTTPPMGATSWKYGPACDNKYAGHGVTGVDVPGILITRVAKAEIDCAVLPESMFGSCPLFGSCNGQDNLFRFERGCPGAVFPGADSFKYCTSPDEYPWWAKCCVATATTYPKVDKCEPKIANTSPPSPPPKTDEAPANDEDKAAANDEEKEEDQESKRDVDEDETSASTNPAPNNGKALVKGGSVRGNSLGLGSLMLVFCVGSLLCQMDSRIH